MFYISCRDFRSSRSIQRSHLCEKRSTRGGPILARKFCLLYNLFSVVEKKKEDRLPSRETRSWTRKAHRSGSRTRTNEKSERKCVSIILARTFFMRSGIVLDVAFNREFYLNARLNSRGTTRRSGSLRERRNTCPFLVSERHVRRMDGKNFYPFYKKD